MKTIGLESKAYAPPAPPVNASAGESAKRSLFLELPAGWYGDWHPTPVRQRLILMSGECEFEAGDGARLMRKAGDAVLLEDTSGRGHRTRAIGDAAVRMAAIHLS
jgi:hypothetical protein